MTDTEAMDHICHIMSGTEWTPGTLDEIAEMVRATGREIANSDDELEGKAKLLANISDDAFREFQGKLRNLSLPDELFGPIRPPKTEP